MSNASRVPPHDIDAERAVLGAMLVTEPALDAALVDVGLEPEDFYLERHRAVFRAIAALRGRGGGVDCVTVCEELAGDGGIEDAGGRGAVYELANTVPAAGNAAHWAEIVRELGTLRRALVLAQRVQAAVYGREAAAGELVERIEGEALEMLGGRDGEGPRRASELIAGSVERLEGRMAGERVEGIPTGFADLDRCLQGLVPGRLVLVAGRPGHGKSTLAVNVGEHVARREGRGVAVFSLEMSGQELADKLVVSRAPVDNEHFARGELDEAEQRAVLRAANQLAEVPLHIDDRVNQTLARIRSTVRRLAARERARGGLALVIVDYVQLIEPPVGRRESANRTEEVSRISRGLKLLGRELGVPMLVCSQLNRAPEHRPNRRPTLADLRESGALEGDADQVVLLYNEGLYEEFPEHPGVVEANVAKNRHGACGIVYLNFQGQFSRFRSADSETVESIKAGRRAAAGVAW